MERDDVLLLPILKHGEGAFVEVGDNVLFIVDHRGVQQDLVHVFAEDEDALIADWIVLRWLILRWLVLDWLALRLLALIVLR